MLIFLHDSTVGMRFFLLDLACVMRWGEWL